ncbi:unnamed protein product, partial [Linum tenue]
LVVLILERESRARIQGRSPGETEAVPRSDSSLDRGAPPHQHLRVALHLDPDPKFSLARVLHAPPRHQVPVQTGSQISPQFHPREQSIGEKVEALPQEVIRVLVVRVSDNQIAGIQELGDDPSRRRHSSGHIRGPDGEVVVPAAVGEDEDSFPGEVEEPSGVGNRSSSVG